MKFFYVAVFVLLIGLAVGWAASPPAPKQQWQPSPEDVAKMDKVSPEAIPYITECFKGKKLIYLDRSTFYELDENGHPIPCVR